MSYPAGKMVHAHIVCDIGVEHALQYVAFLRAQPALEVCAERDPKGLYAKAAAGNLPNMTGMGQSYEAPENADVVLDGAGDLDTQVDTLARAVLSE